jgi:hypothetical protein
MCSEGLDFSPMARDDVLAHVHELLSAVLYQHTFLFYSRHLDTLLLACLYGFCKVNRLQKVSMVPWMIMNMSMNVHYHEQGGVAMCHVPHPWQQHSAVRDRLLFVHAWIRYKGPMQRA